MKVTSKWRSGIDSANVKINRQDNSHIPRELARAAKLHLLHPGLDCHVINTASWKFPTANLRPWMKIVLKNSSDITCQLMHSRKMQGILKYTDCSWDYCGKRKKKKIAEQDFENHDCQN